MKLDALKYLKQIKYKKGKCLITVSGAHSGAGKTFVIEQLLKVLKGWSCIKVTVSRKGLCPKETDCNTCGSLKGDFSIISDKEAIEEKEKDTARFKIAGAKEVLWLISKPGALSRGIKAALDKLKKSKGIIIEGTSVLKYLNPDLAVLVRRSDSRVKQSAKEILKKIDVIITIWYNSKYSEPSHLKFFTGYGVRADFPVEGNPDLIGTGKGRNDLASSLPKHRHPVPNVVA